MKKQLSIGKILMAVLLMLTASLCAFMGVMAVKKSMSLKLEGNYTPSIFCEIEMLKTGESNFRKIFSNVPEQEYVASFLSLDVSTSTLTLGEQMNGGIGMGFHLKVHNYSNTKLFVEASGVGVGTNAIAIDTYSQGTTAPFDSMSIVSVTGDVNLTLTQVYQISPTLVNTTLNTAYSENTLLSFNNEYFVPRGVDLKAQFNLAEPAVSHINFSTFTIAGANATPSSYYSTSVVEQETIHTLNIPSSSITGDIVINGTKAYNDYTVTFDQQGGTGGTTSKTVTYGDPYGAITEPTRTGYTFKGWAGKNLFDLTSHVITSSNITVYPETNEVVFKANVGAWLCVLKPLLCLESSKIYTFSFEVKVDLGTSAFGSSYVFINYATSSNAYSQGTGVTSDYQLKSCKFRYTPDDNVIGQYEYTSDHIHIYKNSTDGKKWYYKNIQIEVGETATPYQEYTQLSTNDLASEVNDKGFNQTYYAIWQANSYIITLDNDGGTTPNTTETSYYSICMRTITPPTHSTKTFEGYYTEVNGAGTQYYNADGTGAIIYYLTENVTLYAKWT